MIDSVFKPALTILVIVALDWWFKSPYVPDLLRAYLRLLR